MHGRIPRKLPVQKPGWSVCWPLFHILTDILSILFYQLLREVCWNLQPKLWICHFLLLAHPFLLHVFWAMLLRALTFRIFMFSWSINHFVIMKCSFKFLVIVLVLKCTLYDISITTQLFKKVCVSVAYIYISILLLFIYW